MGSIKLGLKEINKLIAKSKISDKISDGYHTFGELYEFRKMYNALFFNMLAKYTDIKVEKSLKHHDGEYAFGSKGGWFIVVADLPTGQISNHYDIKDWELFDIPSVERVTIEFDGHTPTDTLKRMEDFIKGEYL